MKNITVGEFIVDTQNNFPGSSGELSKILSAIKLASKIVSHEINKAGLAADIIGSVGNENVQGEEQQKLDLYANDKFINALSARGVICGVASEENESYIAFNSEVNSTAKYVVLIDPLDGSSNIDVNVSVGTIFSVFKRKTNESEPVDISDFLQKGDEQVAAGYIIYGSSTMLVYTTGNGVNGFTFDPGIGVFFLSHPNMKIPASGRLYSVNEGNLNEFKDGVKKCNPVLLEPMMKVEVESPEDFLGSVIGDLSSRRGQVEGQSVDDGLSKVQAKVPLAEMFGYATQLRSMTQGRGIFSMEFANYEEVPRNVAEAIISKNQGNS